MGTTYDPKAPILGMEARRFRNLLASWDRHEANLYHVARTASLDTAAEEVAAVVDEAEARGMLGFPDGDVLNHRFGFLDPGLALLNATNRKRIEAGKAREILGDVLANAAAANARRNLPFAVKAIWLYGSLAKGSETVDDIDLVIETRPPEHMTFQEADSVALRLCRAMGGGSALSKAGIFARSKAHEWVRDRVLFGDRRNPRLSVRSDPHELIGMGAPCRKVFDKAKGANPDAPLLDRHPDSRGRQAHFAPPRVTPDLSLSPPMAPAHCHAAMALALREVGYGENGARVAVACDGERRSPRHLLDFIAACGPLDGRRKAVLHDWTGDGQAILVEASLSDGVLRVSTGTRSLGAPFDDEALDAYLRAVVACTHHRAALRGEEVEAAFVEGEAVDVESGHPLSGPAPGR